VTFDGRDFITGAQQICVSIGRGVLTSLTLMTLMTVVREFLCDGLRGHITFSGYHCGERSYCDLMYSDWLRAGRPRGRSSSPGRIMNFLFSKSSRSALGPTQPPIQWVPGALFPEVKQPGREANHSPTASAEVKKMWIYTSTPLYAFMA
jgi:hypothetical protein